MIASLAASAQPWTEYRDSGNSRLDNASSVTGRRASLFGVQPRRPRRTARNSSFSIHEDIDIAHRQQHVANPALRNDATTATISRDTVQDLTRRTSLLSVAPRRAGMISIHNNAANTTRRRTSAVILATRSTLPPSATTELRFEPAARPARRRTIYVPPEDTTMLTIHPGIPQGRRNAQEEHSRNSDVFLDLATLTEPSLQHMQSEIISPPPVKTAMAVPPRRAPLRWVTRQLQAPAFDVDIPGSGGGKENVPPGLAIGVSNKKSIAPRPPVKHSDMLYLDGGQVSSLRQQEGPRRPASAIRNSKLTTPSRIPNRTIRSPGTACGQTAGAPTDVSELMPTPIRSSVQQQTVTPARVTPSRIPVLSCKTPSKLSVPLLTFSNAQKSQFYPVLCENLTNATLYEDDWLSHQESAITGLINELFEKAGCGMAIAVAGSPLRHKLLKSYDDQTVATLYNRLQASLRFGALSISIETLARVSRTKDDLGQSRKFLDLWMNTYNPDLLTGAVEVVIGREAVSPSPTVYSAAVREPINKHQRHSKNLEQFLTRCLLRNEDGMAQATCSPSLRASMGDDAGTTAWAWRRTVSRSLLLILLIDKAATSGLWEGCIFQPTSPYKTSDAVKQALMTLFVPSVGAPSRVLSRLGYAVTHVQYPLQEYSYCISNLAVDLRNGIMLSRLVELLLYPNTPMLPRDPHETATIAFSFPSSTSSPSRSSPAHSSAWPLSHHLKYPCTSRVQKLYNVQVALDALRATKGVDSMFDHIEAKDVVDGHREKTVGLLWSITARWGLGLLVDFEALTTEIKRLKKMWRVMAARNRRAGMSIQSELDKDEEANDGLQGPSLDLEHQTALLLSWARHAAQLHGVIVDNLSTSFADGRAYQAIADEYHQYVANATSEAATSAARNADGTTVGEGIHAALRDFGCSNSFIALFPQTTASTVATTPSCATQSAPSIPSKQTTVPLLAFLASRFLSAARPHLEAIRLQRWWRNLVREKAARDMWGIAGSADKIPWEARVVRAQIARECRNVVLIRGRIVRAAVVLQRFWRKQRAKKHHPSQTSSAKLV